VGLSHVVVSAGGKSMKIVFTDKERRPARFMLENNSEADGLRGGRER
jgi:hypothetical protein